MSAPKLLLADDSTTIQRVIGLTFANENVQVITVPDGDEAIARIALERPDIVLADIGMPKRSGYDVAAYVKSDPSLAHIPVVLLAGAFEPIDDARARQVGSAGVLVKPFEPQHVITRVRELLAGAKARTVVAPPATVAPMVSTLAPSASSMESDPLPESWGGGELAIDAAGPLPPATAAPSEPLDLALDDYFDRLDAAFAELESNAAANHPGSAPAAPDSTTQDGVENEPMIPTLDELLSGIQPRSGTEVSSQVIDQPLDANQQLAPDVLLDPLDALDLDLGALDMPSTPAPPAEAVEVAEPYTEADQPQAIEATPVVAPYEPAPASVPAATQEVGEFSIDDLANRVLERLQQQAGGNIHDLVANVVSRVAERLIREEIDRIRRQ